MQYAVLQPGVEEARLWIVRFREIKVVQHPAEIGLSGMG